MDAPSAAVRVVRIDQPHARNAVNTATAARLHDEFVAFEPDDDAKVAVLTGDDDRVLRGREPARPAGPAAVGSARSDPPRSCRSR